MKKIFQLALVALLFVAATTSATAQKFGYVNSTEILAELPAMKQANSNLEALQKQLQKKGEAMVEEFKVKATEFQNRVKTGELSPKDQQTQGAALQQEEQKIVNFEQEMVQQIQKKRSELLEPIYENVNNAIAEVAKEGGFTFIFDQQVLLYSEESQDVSDEVRAKLVGK